jgi:hypothetical protein
VALGVTSGTWQQTADIYKRWAIRQPWCRKTLAQRDDLPDWWRRGPCVYVCSVRTVDGARHCTASFYPQLAENLRLFRAKIDGPVVPMLAAWENHRLWTAGDYFPAFDADRAKTVISQIRQEGFHPFVFLSGLYYTYQNGGADGSLVPGWERYLGSFVIDKQTGKPKTFVLSESNKTWNRYSYAFCPAAPGVKEFYRSVLDRLHALGVEVVQMDQAVAGAGDVCYSDSHGHRPGPGPYQASSLHELLGDMRRHGRSLSPDFLLTNEEVHEELIPYVDGFHTREYKEHYWYRDVPGGRGIPLFTYLYHEYAIAYGGDSAGLNARKDANLVRQHAVNLVTGKTPGVAVWSYPRAIVEAHCDQLKMVQNHSHLLKTEAQRFLMLGRMLHPLEFDVPSLTFRIPVAHGEKWRAVPFVERAVLTSSWQSPEGLVGHCLVNVTDAKQPVRLRLDARGAADWPKADVDLYRADAPDAHERVLRDVALPQKYEIELAPLEAVFFVLRPAHLSQASDKSSFR